MKFKCNSPIEDILSEIQFKLRRIGYECVLSNAELRNFRLMPDKLGFNISPYSGRRARILNWNDWVKVNTLVNETLDAHMMDCKVSTLSGKFVIRDYDGAKKEHDWDERYHDNVGSVMSPISRGEAYRREL